MNRSATYFGLAALLFVGAPVPAPEESGVVEGIVRLELIDEPVPTMLSPYARRRYRPPPRSPGDAPGNVVVYIARGEATRDRSDTTVAVVQRDRAILPRVTAVQVGTRIDFPNEDDVFHNLFSLSDVHQFNLGRYPPGESRSVRFEEPGAVPIFCDIHSDMSGVILVLDTPFFARPAPDGHYRIAEVPVGRHLLIAWHPSAGADTTQIVIGNGEVTRADFHLRD